MRIGGAVMMPRQSALRMSGSCPIGGMIGLKDLRELMPVLFNRDGDRSLALHDGTGVTSEVDRESVGSAALHHTKTGTSADGWTVHDQLYDRTASLFTFLFGVGAESEKELHGWIQLYVIDILAF
jgi:hypothetical protein